jgi:hypothetical protein
VLETDARFDTPLAGTRACWRRQMDRDAVSVATYLNSGAFVKTLISPGRRVDVTKCALLCILSSKAKKRLMACDWLLDWNQSLTWVE